jgi:hypothetical protein
MELWVILIGGGVIVCLLVGAAARAASGSRAVGVLAGLAAGVFGVMHTLHAIVLAVGEYEEHRSAYERLVAEAWIPLLLGWTLGPALLLVAAHAAWKWVRGRRSRGPRRAARRS